LRDDGSVLRDEKPLSVWDHQPLASGRLEPRSQSIPWTLNPDALEGTKWRLGIRRWKAVIARPNPEGPDPLRRVVVPDPVEEGEGDDGIAAVKLEHDLIAGEVALKLAIDPTTPGRLTVRIDLDQDIVRENRESRASRLQTLKEDTPKDPKGEEQDP